MCCTQLLLYAVQTVHAVLCMLHMNSSTIVHCTGRQLGTDDMQAYSVLWAMHPCITVKLCVCIAVSQSSLI